MKTIFIHKIQVIMLTLVIISYGSVFAQTNVTTPVTFAVTSTAINKMIGWEWSTITTNWSGSYAGGTYSLQLSQPTIVLTPGNIKLTMSFTVASPEYNGTLSIAPSLSVPTTTITPSQIITQYVDLHQQILTLTALSPALQTLIEQKLSNINWIVYEGEVMETQTTRWTETSKVGWYGLPTLTVSVIANEIDFTVTPTVTATAPAYTSIKWGRPSAQTFNVQIVSNDKLSAIGLSVYDASTGSQIIANAGAVTSTYDAATDSYTSTYSVHTNNGVANNLAGLTFNIQIQRQFNQMLVAGYTGSILGSDNPIVWYPFGALSWIRGE